jgi:hypothetical protein
VTIKPGVQLRIASPQIVLAIVEADRILEGSLVVTCVSDGKHMPGSRHYIGNAADFRLPLNAASFVADLREALGAEYDVVLEGDHVHCEYDPKGPAR